MHRYRPAIAEIRQRGRRRWIDAVTILIESITGDLDGTREDLIVSVVTINIGQEPVAISINRQTKHVGRTATGGFLEGAGVVLVESANNDRVTIDAYREAKVVDHGKSELCG